jgi:hypothetical protein
MIRTARNAQLLFHNVNGELELMLLCTQHESWIITHMTFFDYHTITVQFKRNWNMFHLWAPTRPLFKLSLPVLRLYRPE